MGRNKIVSNEALLEDLLSEASRVGPGALTFAAAAKRTNLSASTLVQRFGTRDAMLEAILLHAWDRLDAATQVADMEAPVTPQGAVDMLLRLMPPDAVEYNVSDGLLLLREDIRRPAARARGAAWGHTLSLALGRRLTRDDERQEMLGWQMASVWQGAHTWWAFTRDRPPEEAIRGALEDWLRTTQLTWAP